MNEIKENSNFIRDIIDNDLISGKHSKIITRFPPEPNGFLHIGHAKAICLNYGIAEDYQGTYHLRFDDTNPEKEESIYIEAIKNDILWLGFNWQDKLFFASDYYQILYDYAELLIQKGKAYVCELSQVQMKQNRGTLTQPGINSPSRDRPIKENLALFRKMKNGDFPDGSKSLRAKIDMASPNMNMRDPVIYRIKKVEHHRTGNQWCIYPMYDYTHCISDAIEGITHSCCSLEFEDHRPLYDWFLDQLPVACHPRQIEFARLELTYTIMSKRLLLHLVNNNFVQGWDDPRLPTIAGMRRRGVTPQSIRKFNDKIGVAKANSVVDHELLMFCVREDLNRIALRRMVVLHPLLVEIENYPDDAIEELEAENNPEDTSYGSRTVTFSKFIYIEKEDFAELPPKGWFRFAIGSEVRLKHAYYVTCKEAIKDQQGNITKLICSYDPNSKGGWTNDGRKVKGTAHWVSARNLINIEVRLFEHLFNNADPMLVEEGKDFTANINPKSITILKNCLAEVDIANAQSTDKFQFLRQGYFCLDPDSRPKNLVFNRIVNLKDSYKKIN